MDRNDFSSMAAYADLMGQMNQAPRGVGPFAAAPVGVASPESMGRLSAYEEMLRTLAGKPKQEQLMGRLVTEGEYLKHASPEELATLGGQDAAITPAINADMADFNAGAIPQDPLGMPGLATKLPSRTKVSQPTEGPTPTEQPAVEPSPDTTPAAAQEIQKAIQETVKTPEDQELLMRGLQRPTPDGSQSMAQRIAMIAMAVAPTAVGMALGGKKGAYIGASATGSGLTAGTKTYQDEEEFRKKMELEREKMGQDRAEKKSAAWEETEDEYGRVILRNKITNEVKPLRDERGEQVYRANEKIVQRSPVTGEIMDERYKFKQRTGEDTSVTAEPIITLKEEIDRYGKDAIELEIPKGIAVAPELTNLAEKYPGISVTGKKPDNISQADWSRLKETYLRWRVAKDKQVEEYQGKMADHANRIEIENRKERAAKEKAAKTVDKDLIKTQQGNLNTYRDREYLPAQIQINKAEKWAGMSGQSLVDGAAIYFDWMKEVQGDDSVIREGDQRTIESYLSFGTKIGQIQAVIDDKGRMSPELRASIIDFLNEVRRGKDRQLAMKTNEMAAQAYESGDATYKAFKTGVYGGVKAQAVGYANRELAGKKEITPQQLVEAIKMGLVGNGSMYRLTNRPGEVFIHTGLMREPVFDKQTGKTDKVLKNVGQSTVWRVQ